MEASLLQEPISHRPLPRLETAYDWWMREQRHGQQAVRDPSSAAWHFGRGHTSLAFLDAALRRQVDSATTTLPVIDLRGNIGKTWTLVTMAARFVMVTRPSLFRNDLDAVGDDDNEDQLPQVIVLDSNQDVTVAKLAYVVRSMLLRQPVSPNPQRYESDMESCLSRIHVATVDDLAEWVAILESIRCRLSSEDQPTLLLWDGFLGEAGEESTRAEAIRQLTRLQQECAVLVLLVPGTTRKHEYDKLVTHRVRLESLPPNGDRHGPKFQATVCGTTIPFSISLAGILS